MQESYNEQCHGIIALGTTDAGEVIAEKIYRPARHPIAGDVIAGASARYIEVE